MSEREGGQAYIDATELISLLRQKQYVTPHGLAQSRRRENVIRLQLRELSDAGWVVEFSHDLFCLSTDARRFFTGSDDLSSHTFDPCAERITNLSEMDAETIKQFNLELYENQKQQYGLVENSHEKTVRKIKNVKESRLNRLLREFPVAESLCEQCAHWARAICGKHFFPDANHRTAMASLSALLNLNGITIADWPGKEIDRTVLKAKFARAFLVEVRFDTLWKRDELFHVWHRHFRDLLYDIEEERYRHLSRQKLRRSLNAAREVR